MVTVVGSQVKLEISTKGERLLRVDVECLASSPYLRGASALLMGFDDRHPTPVVVALGEEFGIMRQVVPEHVLAQANRVTRCQPPALGEYRLGCRPRAQ